MNYRSLLTGAALGAGVMFLLDPNGGRRRRALLRDKAVRSLHKTGDAVGTTGRDMANRARGIVAETRSKLRKEEIPDEVLLERVRSELGRVVSHPGSVQIAVAQGRVTLAGPILADEADEAIARVESLGGVAEVENRLDVHEEPGRVPGLQGGRRREPRAELLQTNWSPTARLLGGLAGAGMIAYGVRRRGPIGALLGSIGAGMLTRGASNMELKRVVGVGGGRRAILVQKTITLAAPADEVYAFWNDYENFPHFMTNVREVRDLGAGRSHWVVSGPAGTTVEWDAVVTERVPGRLIAWKSEPGQAVANAGVVRFQPTADGGTRVDVRLSYNPPAGGVGHAVATLFGADPKTQIDQDLLRMKTLIETGQPPRDAAQPEGAASRSASGVTPVDAGAGGTV